MRFIKLPNQPYANLAKALEQDKQELANLLKVAEKSYQSAQNTVIQAAERESNKLEKFLDKPKPRNSSSTWIGLQN